ncbi:MAG: hypothetical protein Q9195_006982 [Heterodermia aff. obscurata]
MRGHGRRASLLLGSGSGKSNLWTLAERDDLFKRRQHGEDWESICQDYPTRSRHALQQQYSVEKKKHAGAIDLRIGSRRGGRKPRAAQTRGHNWTSINKLPVDSDEEVDDSMGLIGLDEDDEDTDYEDIGNQAEEESSQAPEEESPRPPPLARSATEPTTRQKAAKKAMFPNLPASAGKAPSSVEDGIVRPIEVSSTKRKTPMHDVSESESRASSHQSKRPKYSTEPSETFPAAQHLESTPVTVPKTPKTPLPIIKRPRLIFTEEDYERASNYATELASLHEADKNALREVFESARQRDVRRANEAEAQRNEAVAEYAGRLKFKEAEFTKELAGQKEQARIDAQFESDRHQQEIALLRTEVEELKVSSERSVLVQSSAAGDDIRQQLARQESQLKLYDQLRSSITSEVEKPLKSRLALGEKADEVKVQHTVLTNMISQINVEFEDLSSKAIIRSLKEIQDTNEALLETRKAERRCLDETMDAMESFVKPFKGGAEMTAVIAHTDTAASDDVSSKKPAMKVTVPETSASIIAAATPTASGSPRKKAAR